jgi:hypothetical protein
MRERKIEMNRSRKNLAESKKGKEEARGGGLAEVEEERERTCIIE